MAKWKKQVLFEERCQILMEELPWTPATKFDI